jgi:CheY-like chemotaxis protein
MVQEALKEIKSPCQLAVAKNGIEAIESLRQERGADPLPDLILLDLNLPLKDGRAVLREIKQDDQLKHIPVLIFTSSQAPDDVLAAYRLHANCYLTKPTRMSEFFALIASIEEFWTKLVQVAFIPANT